MLVVLLDSAVYSRTGACTLLEPRQKGGGDNGGDHLLHPVAVTGTVR
jgi:hypothetical protein